MKSVAVVVFDKVANQYGVPTSFTNIDCAVRWFKSTMLKQDECNRTDYELYRVFDFNSDTGVVDNVALEFICKGGAV